MYDVQVGAFTKAGTGAMCEIHKGLTDVMGRFRTRVSNFQNFKHLILKF